MFPRHPAFRKLRRQQIALPATLPIGADELATVPFYIPVPAVGRILRAAVAIGTAPAETVDIDVTVGSSVASFEQITAATAVGTVVEKDCDIPMNSTADAILVEFLVGDALVAAEDYVILIDYEVAV